jgi:transposase
VPKKSPHHGSDEVARLRAERDEAVRELKSLRQSIRQLAKQVAGQNERLDQLLSMLRRREDQLKRLQTENRKLRRKLGLDDDEPDPGGRGASTTSASQSDEPAEPSPSPTDPADEASGTGSATGPDQSAQASVDARPDAPADPPRPNGETGDGRGSTTSERARSREGGGRNLPPSHLPRDTERCTVEKCPRCGKDRLLCKDVIISEKYDVVESYVRVRRLVRDYKVCATPDCNERVVAEMPPMPYERAHYTCAFIAWLVVMKFVLLVPLDRIRRHLESQGVYLPESTLVHLIERAADLAAPIDGEHWRQLRARAYLAFDGTGLKCLIEGQDKAWDAYLTVFSRDELTVFAFDLTKHADRLAQMVHGFLGVLMCDAESRNGVVATEDRPIANCNAHPRRKFRDAERAQPDLAAQGGRFIQAMYELEAEARSRELTGDDLVAFRTERIGRVLRRFRTWLDGVLARDLPPTDPVRRAAQYYVNHFVALTLFLTNPLVPLDNNASEREFQHHAKLRQQSLFAGSPEGGHRWAILLGVVRTATKCGVDVFAYLKWMFERRGTHRRKFALPVAQLTPMAYAAELEAVVAAAIAA